MSNNRAFFSKKICMGCKKAASIFSCTGTGNKTYCAKCHKKFVNQKFNGIAFKSLDEIAKENLETNK